MPNIPISDILTDATGSAAVIAWLATESTSIQSTLALSMATGDLTATISTANWQPATGKLIGIDSEICTVTAKNGSVLTVTRGVGGTAVVAHAVGALVRELKYQSTSEGLRDQVVKFVRQRISNDATINAGITSATAARDAVVIAAVY